MKQERPLCTLTYCPKQEEKANPIPGDFILTKGNSFYDTLIRFGQGFRFTPPYSQWNHAALVIGEDGTLIEAEAGGIKTGNISKYLAKDYFYIHLEISVEDRIEVVNFAKACLGEKYGWTTIVSIALSLLTGLHFSFGFYGQEICSGLVARALERTTAIFPRDPSHMTPADLAQLYEIPKS